MSVKGINKVKARCVYCKWWGNIYLPGKEKEMVGFYLSGAWHYLFILPF